MPKAEDLYSKCITSTKENPKYLRRMPETTEKKKCVYCDTVFKNEAYW
jgi:aspartate carbamoyltransferase regulatory subunit